MYKIRKTVCFLHSNIGKKTIIVVISFDLKNNSSRYLGIKKK